ncbi:hypothetical protein [Erwinia sp. HR93]|uniref:hypothetical protein n=1 Tax=Erwinia sp. HR93 TaxID=3094840 RepID=UPI002ADECA26|nr:hypothetical protein [Erwinia sp. HR93]MEA1063470.1 hypothetical protein [Erwinia sp. HR93]
MDSAWDIASHTKVYSDELWALEEIDTSGYVCWGCGIPVYPAAYAKRNAQRPHFRLYRNTAHRYGCHANTEMGIIEHGRRSSVREHLEKSSDLSPAGLALTPANTGKDRGEARLRNGSAAITTSREYAATLRPICRAFIHFPHDRDMSLRVPNAVGNTYATIFKKLPAELPRIFPENKIFYSKLSNSRLIPEADSLLLHLAPYAWEGRKPTGEYLLNLGWSRWNARQKYGIEHGLEAARLGAIEAKKARKKDEAWVFFLGQQDRARPELFHVSDPRLVYVMIGDISVPV